MLGLSPMAGIKDEEFRANRLQHFGWSRALERVVGQPLLLQPPRPRRFQAKRFYGVEQQTYFASDCLFNDFRVVATLRMAGAL